MAVRNLASLDRAELKAFLDSFDDVLCDCGGVVWTCLKAVPGVPETISTLKKCEKRVRYVSNNSTLTMEDFRDILNGSHIDVTTDDIMYPGLAIIDYLQELNFSKEIFLLGTSSMREEFTRAGLKLAPLVDTDNRSAFAIREIIRENNDVGAVVVDCDVNMSYANIVNACMYLERPDVLYLAGASDKRLPIAKGRFVIGPNYFHNIISRFTGRTPISFGKPTEVYCKFVSKKFNIQDPSRTLCVGDGLEQDMGFASRCGYQKLFVLTGRTTFEEMHSCPCKPWIPNYYVESFGDLHYLLKQKLGI